MDLAILDYWVSRAERMNETQAQPGAPLIVRNYSSDPKHAEPIISRERIVISHIVGAELGEKSIAWVEHSGDADHHTPGAKIWMGDTDLEAAMLCYLSVKFGDELSEAFFI
jgi:hypothetical protein